MLLGRDVAGRTALGREGAVEAAILLVASPDWESALTDMGLQEISLDTF